MAQTVLDALEESIIACKVDTRKQAAPLAAARKLAALMDEDGWPIVKGRFDNVTPATFLKYCEELGLLGSLASHSSDSTLVSLRSRLNGKAG